MAMACPFLATDPRGIVQSAPRYAISYSDPLVGDCLWRPGVRVRRICPVLRRQSISPPSRSRRQ